MARYGASGVAQRKDRSIVHHTTEAYRYLGEELDHLDLMRYWCRACHEFSHNRGPDPMVSMSWRELEERINRL